MGADRFKRFVSNGELPGGSAGWQFRRIQRAHGIQPTVGERRRETRKPLGGREDSIDRKLLSRGFVRTKYGWKFIPKH